MDEERGTSEREQEDSFLEAKSNLSGEEADTESNSSSVRSLFDTLQAPTPSVLARKNNSGEGAVALAQTLCHNSTLQRLEYNG